MMPAIQNTLREVLSVIKPTPEEARVEIGFAELLVSQVSRNAPAGAEAVLVGSMAKRTFLRDKRDVDIFVLFPPAFPRPELEEAVRGIMARSFPGVNYQVSYAEHPYARFHFQGRRIDLVPAYRITKASERISAVDRSVLHTDYVTKALKKGQADQVLLLKQFLRSGGIYGAEIKVEGFSGYLCELLIIKYGSFLSLMKAASRWKGPLFIDLAGHYRNKKEIAQAMRRFGPFTVIDPTDKGRNVAAAVSRGSLMRLASLSKAFLKRPAAEQFFRREDTFDDLVQKAASAMRGKSGAVFVLSMPRPPVVDDVLWGQLRKMMSQLEAHLSDFSPKPIHADDGRHLVRLLIVLGKTRLSGRMLLCGPPLRMEGHVTQFRASHPKARFIKKGGNIWAWVRRPVIAAEDSIRGFFLEFASVKSHLAYHEEMLILEKVGAPAKAKKIRR